MSSDLDYVTLPDTYMKRLCLRRIHDLALRIPLPHSDTKPAIKKHYNVNYGNLIPIPPSAPRISTNFKPQVAPIARYSGTMDPVELKDSNNGPSLVDLSGEQKRILEYLNEGTNFYFTGLRRFSTFKICWDLLGKAGTGKSVLIRSFVEEARARKRRVAVLAPTGLSAAVVRHWHQLWNANYSDWWSNYPFVRWLPDKPSWIYPRNVD